MIKSLLKKVLPLPANTMNRRMDEVMLLLGDLSRKLARLEKETGTIASAQKTLEARQKNIDGRQKNIEERQKSIDSLQKSIDERQKNIEARQTSIDERQKGIEERQKSIEELQASTENSHRRVADIQHGIEARQAEFGEFQQYIGKLTTDILARQENTEKVVSQIMNNQSNMHVIVSNIFERQTGIMQWNECTSPTIDYVRDTLNDARITGINTENRLVAMGERLVHMENRLIWIRQMAQAIENREQAEHISENGGLENFYLLQHIRRIREAILVKDVEGGRLVRLGGRDGDGGYVMLDDFKGKSIAYSFGIADDVSWDREMAARGLDVYMYDHTIESIPEEDAHFHWRKTGVIGTYDEARPELQTLPMLVEENGHGDDRHMILKIDVEGCEWDVLANIPKGFLDRFSQIAFEFHGLNDLDNEDAIVAALGRLNETHIPVHVHANNCVGYMAYGGLVMPDVLECTYLNRKEYSFRKSHKFFPTKLDISCTTALPEIMLGCWGVSPGSRIIQLVPNMHYGDAVGGDILALDGALRDAGFDATIYAIVIDSRIDSGRVHSVSEMPEPEPDDIVVYHMATGCRPIRDMLTRFSCRKVMIYHNMTPPSFFEEYSDRFVTAAQNGYDDLEAMKDTFECCIAVSRYNRDCLRQAGYRCPIPVLPVIVPFADYEAEPDKDIVSRYGGDGWVNLIFVGRVVPNKKQEDIIRAYVTYKQRYNEKSRLFIVGNYAGMEDYYLRLQHYVSKIGADDVRFTGHIPFSSILAYYRVADVFISMSEHEGFCVPLIEAMKFDVPIVAYAAAAIPETLGGAGMIFAKKDYARVAAAIDVLVTNRELCDRVLASQRRRLADFSYENISRRAEKIFTGLVGKNLADYEDEGAPEATTDNLDELIPSLGDKIVRDDDIVAEREHF